MATGFFPHEVVSRDEWTRQRIELLKQEKEFTRHRDRLNQARSND